MDAGAAVGAVARVVLAGTFVVAAVGKLRAPDDTRDALEDLFDTPWMRTAAHLLPVGELVVAVLLVTWWGSVVPGVIALVVLAVFTGVLVRAHLRGVPCACFGAIRPEPPGMSSLVRNGVLAGLAVLATGV